MKDKTLRKATNLSQDKFARYLGIPLTNIQHWEQGYRTPPEYVIDMMARILLLEHKVDNEQLCEIEKSEELEAKKGVDYEEFNG